MEHWTRSIFSTVYLSFEGVDVANLRYLPLVRTIVQMTINPNGST